jgi:hypothetical protein
MKSVLGLGVLFIFLGLSPAHALMKCDQSDTELLAWANNLNEGTRTDVASGRLSARDFKATSLFLLEVKYCLKKIGTAEFCKEALPASEVLVESNLAIYQFGGGSVDTTIQARKDMAEIKAICNGVKLN